MFNPDIAVIGNFTGAAGKNDIDTRAPLQMGESEASFQAVVHEVTKTALLYGAIGLFQYIFRKPFLAISMSHENAEASGLNVRLWDFLFYASFGFVVTSSVAIAGVLLVFWYLIVPSVAAMLFAENIGPRLAIGWTMGTVVSGLGVWLSLQLDLPTGATIVCTFGLALALMAIVGALMPRRATHTAGVVGTHGAVS